MTTPLPDRLAERQGLIDALAAGLDLLTRLEGDDEVTGDEFAETLDLATAVLERAIGHDRPGAAGVPPATQQAGRGPA